MRSTRNGLHQNALVLAGLLLIALLAAFVIDVIVVHRKQHGHDVSVWMGAQGAELQSGGVGAHGLNCSPMNAARA